MSRLCVAAFVLVGSLCGTVSAKAGPLPPCISATLSANGNALVVNDLTLGGRVGDIPREVKASKFRVFRSSRVLSNAIPANGPGRFWTDPSWELVFTKAPSQVCSYVWVTDDAEYLVFVGDENIVPAVSIYRWDHSLRPIGSQGADHGVLVRQLHLSDLSRELKAPDGILDGAPQWFAGGAFSFSADERTLIFTMSDGKRLQINLLTGDVER